MAQLVILTDSYDTTTDLLINRMNNERDSIFRLNYDLISSYDLKLDYNSFTIVDPCKRVATLESVTKFVYRKPNRQKVFSSELSQYTESENWAAIRSLIGMLWAKGRIVLIEPYDAMLRLDKITQLRIASQLFSVPETLFSLNIAPDIESSKILTKSLSGMWVGQRLLYATVVDKISLDYRYPWFCQRCIDAAFDLTVIYIRGQIFAFKLNRSFLYSRDIVDWKQEMAGHGLNGWEIHYLSEQEKQKITHLMTLFHLHYGRLDFLIDDSNNLIFLEINPNGQFAWLDINDKYGVLTSYCNEISPATSTIPIPWSPYLSSGET